MNGHPAEFDPATQAYLKDLDKRSGAGHDGVFIRRHVSPFSGPRSGWDQLLLVGGICLAGALIVCFLPGNLLTVRNQTWMCFMQAAATGVGLFCLLSGVVRYRRRVPAVELRSFLFADGAYLWDVTPDQVRVEPLAELTATDSFHRFEDGVNTRTSLTLTFRDGQWLHELYEKKLAERLRNFLQAQRNFRASPEPEIRRMAAVSPGWLARMAIRVADGRRGGVATLSVECPNPPIPARILGCVEPDRPTSRGLRLRAFTAAAVGCLSLVAFKAIDRYVLDEHLFAHVPVAYPGDIRAFDRYLNALPDGRHVAEVQERKHEYLFQWALEAAEQARSPAELRTAFDR